MNAFKEGLGEKGFVDGQIRDAFPQMRRLAYLYNPEVTGKERERASVKAAAETLGLAFTAVRVRAPDRIEPAFEQMARDGAEGVVVAEDLFTLGNRALIVAASVQHKLPGVFALREFAEFGGSCHMVPT